MARVRVLDFTGGAVAQGHVRVLDFVGASAARARVRVLDFAGDVVVSLAANAGPDVTVEPLTRVYLTGAASSGRPDLWHWQQTGGTGPIVALQPSADVSGPSFIAPATPDGCTLKFTLSVALDPDEYVASPDEVTITVLPHPVWIRLNGQTRPISLAQMGALYGIDL